MAIANDTPAPGWGNIAAWGAVGAIFYFFALWGGISIMHDGGVGAVLRQLPRSTPLAATLGFGLIFAMALTGFTSRKRPFNPRTLRNFVIQNAAAVIITLLMIRGFTTLARAGTMPPSEGIAVMTGLLLIAIACLGAFALASAHTRADLIDDEMASYELRERARLMLYSFAWMAAYGALLVLLSVAGAGMLSPKAALAGALGLIAVLILLGIATWRLSDELGRTLSHETGNMAFYLILLLGGGWAMLAHLGFVAAPAPLDWLTLFTVLLYAATFIVMGRRKLLTR